MQSQKFTGATFAAGSALLGVQARNGVQCAVDEINEESSFAGKKVKLIVEDTGTSGAGAINALNRVKKSRWWSTPR